MPWLAIPFSDLEKCDQLSELFQLNGIPYLVILDETGTRITKDGVKFIDDYGVEAYPFTSARIQELKDLEEEARKNQSLKFCWADAYPFTDEKIKEMDAQAESTPECWLAVGITSVIFVKEMGTFGRTCVMYVTHLHTKCPLMEKGCKHGWACDAGVCKRA